MYKNNTSLDARQLNKKLVIEIAVILCCKLTIIFGLWYCFFSPEHRIEQTSDNVAAGILSRGPVTQNTKTITQGEPQ